MFLTEAELDAHLADGRLPLALVYVLVDGAAQSGDDAALADFDGVDLQWWADEVAHDTGLTFAQARRLCEAVMAAGGESA